MGRSIAGSSRAAAALVALAALGVAHGLGLAACQGRPLDEGGAGHQGLGGTALPWSEGPGDAGGAPVDAVAADAAPAAALVEPELVLRLSSNVFWDLVVTDGYLLFSGPGGGACTEMCVQAVPRAGDAAGQPRELGALEGPASSLVLRQDRLYWSYGLNAVTPHASLARATLGDSIEVENQDLGGLDAYWLAESSGRLFLGASSGLYQVDGFGSAPTQLYPGTGEYILSLFADGDRLFFVEGSDWKRLDLTRLEEGPKVLAPAGNYYRVHTQDEDSVYWMDGPQLRRLVKDSGEVSVLARDLDVSFPTMAAAGGHVYVVEHDRDSGDPGWGARVLRIPSAGGAPVVLARDKVLTALALDSTHVYFASSTLAPEIYPEATIRRVPR